MCVFHCCCDGISIIFTANSTVVKVLVQKVFLILDATCVRISPIFFCQWRTCLDSAHQSSPWRGSAFSQRLRTSCCCSWRVKVTNSLTLNTPHITTTHTITLTISHARTHTHRSLPLTHAAAQTCRREPRRDRKSVA